MSSGIRKPDPRAKSWLDRPYTAGDSIPAPEVSEKSGDSAWALWTEVTRQQEERFAPTAPASLPVAADPQRAWAATAPARMEDQPPGTAASDPVLTLDAAMLVARRNNRVCPRPQRWQAIYEMLCAGRADPAMPMPPAPATGAAWNLTPPLGKRLCFREQVEWAQRHGVLEALMAAMVATPESEWLHMGED